MEIENASSSTTVHEAIWDNYSIIWVIVSLILFSIVSDILILIIIRRTRTLRSYTGDLLTSQVSSCIPRQLISLMLIFTANNVQQSGLLQNVRYTSRLLLTGFQGITAHTLTAICLNLYLAVCHNTLYRTRMSRVYVLVFIPVCWIINIFVGLCPLASQDVLFVSLGMTQAPSYEGSAFGVWLFIVIFIYIIPAAVTAFAFFKIWSYSRKIRPLSLVNGEFRDKFLLAKLVVGLATCYISLWSLMHVLRAMQTKYESKENGKTTFRDLAAVPYFLNLLHDAFKLGLYMLIYKPIQVTVLEIWRRKRNESTRLTTVKALSTQNRSISQV